MAKHGKKMKSEKKMAGGKRIGKPKRSSKIFSVYIYRVMKQVHPELTISSKAMEVMNNFMQDVFTRLANESAGLLKFSRKSTLTSSDIQTAARLALPGELSKHAVSEGTKAVARFLSSKKEISRPAVPRAQPAPVSKRVQDSEEDEEETEKRPAAKRVAREGMTAAVKAPPRPVKGVPPVKPATGKNLAEAKKRKEQEELEAKRAQEEAEKKRKEEAELKRKEEAEAKKRAAEAKKQEVEAKKREQAEAKKRKQEEEVQKKEEAAKKKEEQAIKKKEEQAKKKEEQTKKKEEEAKKKEEEAKQKEEEAKQKEEEAKKKEEEVKKRDEEEEEEELERREERSASSERENQAPDSTSQPPAIEIVIPVRPEKRPSLRSYRRQHEGEPLGPEAETIRIEAHVPPPQPTATQESLPESSQESALSFTMEPSSQETGSSQRTDFSSDFGTQETSFTNESFDGERQTVVTVTYTRVTATAVVTTPGRDRANTSETYSESDLNTQESGTA